MNQSMYEVLLDNRNARIESFKSLQMLNLWTKKSPKEKDEAVEKENSKKDE